MRVWLILFLAPVFSLQAQTSISPLLQNFEEAIRKNSYRKAVRTMDTDYTREQCMENLQGNTEQFIDEFLSSGLSGDYQAVSLRDIEVIYLIGVHESEQRMYIDYRCMLTGGEMVKLHLEASWDVNKKRWGFIGPYG